MGERSEFAKVLANYESSELVRRQFREKHGRGLSAGKAQEICAAFTQARGYLGSARQADRIVRPLLAYYGVLSLSRGLTLFLSKTMREAGLAQSHGLSVVEWGQELSLSGRGLAALKLKINANGSFRQLIEATKHESLLRNNNSSPNVDETLAMPPADTDISLADVLSRVPEIRPVYRRWRDDKNMVGVWPEGPLGDGRHKLRILHGYAFEDVQQVLGSDAVQLDDKSSSVLYVSVPSNATIPLASDCVGSWNVGNLVAMTRYPGDVQLSKIATAFVVSYALGMLVRYYPSHWIAMLQNRANDAAMPSLLAALQHVEDEFPRFVVEFLERPTSLGGQTVG